MCCLKPLNVFYLCHALKSVFFETPITTGKHLVTFKGIATKQQLWDVGYEILLKLNFTKRICNIFGIFETFEKFFKLFFHEYSCISLGYKTKDIQYIH